MWSPCRFQDGGLPFCRGNSLGWETHLSHLTLYPRGMDWVLSNRAHEGISGQSASGRTAVAEDKGPLGKRLMSFSPCLSLLDRKPDVKRGKRLAGGWWQSQD